ncbi:MAG: calcium-binding protein [Candidatus Thiodiazotropha sp.]
MALIDELTEEIEAVLKKVWGGSVKTLARDAEAVSYGNGIDGISDAEREMRNGIAHTHRSITDTRLTDKEWAEKLGDYKENTPDTYDSADEWKDQYNNALGRKIAQWMEDNGYTENSINPDTGQNYTPEELDKIQDDLVMDAVNTGDVIGDPTQDPRMDGTNGPVNSKGIPTDPTTGDPNDPDTQEPLDPKTEPTWTEPTPGTRADGKPNWTDSSQGRDYTGLDVPNPFDDPLGYIGHMAAEGLLEAIQVAKALYDAGVAAADAMTSALNALADTLQDIMDSALSSLETASDFAQEVWDTFWAAWNAISPLVVDLDADGVELVALADTTVYWDIDEDGFAEASGWVAADDGLLAIDLDGDGMITQHSELFGDSVYADGFAALAVYDTNADNVIDANDAQFGDLLVWQDVNQNGISEANELHALADLDIISINLNATSVNQTNAGHDVKLVSTYTMDDGISGPQTLDIVDVWFQYDNLNSNFAGDYTLDIASLFLTTQRGYGNLPDMHIASSMDNDPADPNSLMNLLTTFSTKDFAALFTDNGAVLTDVRDIMFRWAGVDGVDPASRGDFVDARELGFLEKFVDEIFHPGADPAGGQGELLSEAFDIALQGIAPRLIAQAAGKDLFEGNVLYNPATDAFDGITGLSQSAVDTLLTKAQDAAQVSDKVAFWGDVVRVVEEVVGVANLSTGDATGLETAIMTSDSTLTTQLILDTLAWNSDLGQIINGTTGIDNLLGTIGDDTIYGGYGNDEVLGGIGADTLRGGAHNDTLNGQSGDDALYGESGNDTYLYIAGQGQDSVYEQNGTDNILFGPGIGFSDLTLSRISNDTLQIDVSEAVGGGRVTILNQFTASKVETLNFNDGSSADLSAINYTLTGTAGADTLKGVRYGGGQDDTIYGLEGDDMIYGYNGVGDYGDNWLYGGAGSDTIYGAYGVDYIEGGTEDDHIRGYNGNDELHGGAGDDEILGGNNDDLLYGDAGADILKGENNNDTLIGGLGADELWSGNGYDTFAFLNGESFDAVDTIKDLNTIYDVIDISDLLSAYDPLTDVITDFVQITDNGTDSTLAIDADGGADAFIAIATIAGKTGLTDEAALESSGLLIAA